MRERIGDWLLDRQSIGTTVALVIASVLVSVSHSFWPLAGWFVCALGAAFDEGWNTGRREHEDSRA